ncbi:MAG: glycosyltransferase family 39 protein [Clostridia bacterium]
MVKEKILKKENLIIVVLFICLILRCIAMIQLRPDHNLNSDDIAFIDSGIMFKNTGKITMHGVESAKNMPGMTFIIAIFSLLFGEYTIAFWVAIKLFWIMIGVVSVYGVYKIIKIYASPIIASLICLFFCAPDFILLDNLILTETPYMLCNVFLIYASLQLANTQKNRYYWMIVIFYMVGLVIRPTIALFPLILFIYLLLKKYDIKLMLKQGCIALGILLIILIPWWYRNYRLFNEFIPLTYGTGDPMLLGTYQGSGWPSDEELDYTEYLNEESDDIKKHLGNDKEYTSLKQWAIFRDEENMAKFRMHKWWEKNKISMIKSYFLVKPLYLIYGSFYWTEVFHISQTFNLILRRIDIILCLFSILCAIFLRSRWKEIFFVGLVYAYQIVLYSYTFAFARYGQVLIFFRYIIIGWMMYEVHKYLKERKVKKLYGKNCSINTML